MESIFSAPDIQRQLPAEAKMFLQVDKSWKEVMRKVNRLPNALRAATQPGNNTVCLNYVLLALNRVSPAFKGSYTSCFLHLLTVPEICQVTYAQLLTVSIHILTSF